MLKETFYNTFDHPYVVINHHMDIVQINGDVGFYLSFSHGLINTSIIKQSQPDLQIALRATINKAIKEKITARSPIKRLEHYGTHQFIRILVKPLAYSPPGQDLYVVIFEKLDTELGLTRNTSLTGPEEDQHNRIQNWNTNWQLPENIWNLS
jgi:hypothetical protein